LGIGIGFGLICLERGVLEGYCGRDRSALGVSPQVRRDTYQRLYGLDPHRHLPVNFVIMQLSVAAHYSHSFADQAIMNQSLRRVWASVEEHRDTPWYYLEILEV